MTSTVVSIGGLTVVLIELIAGRGLSSLIHVPIGAMNGVVLTMLVVVKTLPDPTSSVPVNFGPGAYAGRTDYDGAICAVPQANLLGQGAARGRRLRVRRRVKVDRGRERTD